MRYCRPWEPGTDISPRQTAFAAAHRIPFLSTRYPVWFYLVGFIVDDTTIGGEVPTNEEIEVIAAVRDEYLDRVLDVLNRSRAGMKAFAPYDIDGGGAVCLHFLKRAEGNWACQRSSNAVEAFIFPNAWEAPRTLEEVLVREHLIR